ncbi:MAG: S9 family peptidase [Alistipes sp.]|nr:S9 family peptidase [Alistipes sp.]MBR5131037.1 S9 family peptidase [Alistipes sp.]
MKKILFIMTFASLLALGSCDENSNLPKPLAIDNHLTEAEKAEGKFTAEVMWKMARIGAQTLSEDGSKLVYALTEYNLAENRGVTTLHLRDMASGEEVRLTDYNSSNHSAQWIDAENIAFLSNRSGSSQVWAMDVNTKAVRQLTAFDNDVEGFGIAGDHAFYVQRVKVAPLKGSDKYADMDKSKVRIYDDLMVRHWDYWDDGSYLHIFAADYANGKIAEGKDIIGADKAYDAPLAPYFDCAEIRLSPDGTKLAYTCKPLTGTEYALSTDSDIFLYDFATETTRNLSKEAAATGVDKFVGYDKYPVFSPDGTKIAFRSQRRPGNEADQQRLWVFDLNTNKCDYITRGQDYCVTEVAWDGNEAMYFILPWRGTHHVARIGLDGKMTQITKGNYDFNTFTFANGKIVANMNSISKAVELYDVNPATGEFTQLTDVNREIYDNIKFGEVQERWIKTTDGKEMLTWVILPPDFDPAKKYPTLLYCQGGPQSTVSQFWSYRWNFQLMAAQGYVIVAPNRRGCPSFGQEWTDQISGDYSGQNIKDYLAAIDEVSKEPWVDKDHRGCVGASYGGYSTYYLAGVHQNRFKAFIAHCGIFNFESMYGHTEELFFVTNDYGGAYWEKNNATAQRSYANSPHKLVANWNAPIMIITGEKDYRIPYSQSLEAFTAARVQGIDARLVSFENEAHQVFQPQNSVVWNREFFAWLDKYLK